MTHAAAFHALDGGRDDIYDFRSSDGDRIDVSAYGFAHLEGMTITILVGFAAPHILQVSDFIFA